MTKRVAITALAFICSIVIFDYVMTELLVYYEMTSTGTSNRHELSDDFGLGILVVFIGWPLTIFGAVASAWYTWRKLKGVSGIGVNILSKQLIVLLATAFLFAVPVCGSAAETHNYKKPEDVVAWVYRDFAFDAIMPMYWENASLIQQPRKILLLYFTDELASMILKDRQCVKETHETCNLNFDPIFASQDPGAMDLSISPADTSNTVNVQFRYPGNGTKIVLAFKVKRTKSGWRINDIIYSDFGSLRELLSKQQ